MTKHTIVTLDNHHNSYTVYEPGEPPRTVEVVSDDEPNPLERARGIKVGAIAILAFLALVVGMALSGGCAMPATRQPVTPAGRSPAEQAASSVYIERACAEIHTDASEMELSVAGGSGAVIAPGRVLTARHVVTCQSGEFLALRVHTLSRLILPATVAWQDSAHDLAILDVPGIEPAVALRVAPAVVGSEVCAETARPERKRVCGYVMARIDRAAPNGIVDVQVTSPIVPGNSGAAMYDGFGRLIAIVTNWSPCTNDVTRSCGGTAVSLIGRVP